MTAFFNQARRNAPCIVFIDEIDGIGGVRTGLHDSQILHALLTGVDSIKRHELILFVAATNRPEVLDPALVRPGRFDRKFHMGRPRKEGRKAILRRILKDYDVDSPDDERLAVLTEGFTGAMLVNLMNESALAARRKARKAIDQEVIEETQDLVRYGPETDPDMAQEERRQVAVHELGHGLLTLEFNLETLHKVSLISRSDFLGMSGVLPDEKPAGRHRGYWLRKIAVCLGGPRGRVPGLRRGTGPNAQRGERFRKGNGNGHGHGLPVGHGPRPARRACEFHCEPFGSGIPGKAFLQRGNSPNHRSVGPGDPERGRDPGPGRPGEMRNPYPPVGRSPGQRGRAFRRSAQGVDEAAGCLMDKANWTTLPWFPSSSLGTPWSGSSSFGSHTER